MKKLISSLLCAVMLLLSVLTLCSCHKGIKSESFVIPDGIGDEPIELTFWAKNDSNLDQVNTYKAAIARFEALYPNVTVKLVSYSDYGRIYGDVITNIATGTTPNICITYPDHIATYKTGSNVVVPLDDLINDPAYGLGGSELKFEGPAKDEIVPKFLEECELDGKYYALPYMRSTEACYVNRDMVETLGYELPEVLTWDFVFEVSEKAMEKNPDGTYKVNGQTTLIPFIYKSTDNMMISMLKQQDAPYSTDLGEVQIFNETTDEILLDIAKMAEMRAFSTFKISSYPGNYFNRGQCIFAIDSTAGATWIGTEAPNIEINDSELIEFTTEVMMIPQYDEESPDMISQGPSVCIFNKEDPEVVLASWLFMQYLLTDEVQIAYATTEGYCPVTLKAQSTEEYQEYLSSPGIDDHHYRVKIEATKLLIDNIENTFVTPVFNGSASLRSAAGQLIEEITKGERKGDDVTLEYVKDVYDKVSALYNLSPIDTNAPLPATSILLLSAILVTWLGIGGHYLYGYLKKKRG